MTNLAKAPEYFKDVLRLIEDSFGYNKEESFERDFFPLINPLNHRNCHLIIDQDTDQVVSHIALKKREIRVKNNKYPIILLGGIVTNREYRSQGHFKKLFNEIINKYQDKCTFFLLWSEKSELYNKYQFHEFGTVIQTGEKVFNENEVIQLGFEKTTHKDLSEKDKIRLKDIHDKNFFNYISLNRTARDWYDISQISSSDLYIKKVNGLIEHYFFVHKGKDLKDIIHECSFFTDEEMIEELSHFKLWLPEKHKSYIKHVLSLYIGLIKIGENTLFKDFIQDVYSNELYVSYIDSKNVKFEFKNKAFETSLEEFIQLTLGPSPAEEFIRYAPWISISGLDSI